MISRYATLSPDARQLLSSPSAPVVLLPKKEDPRLSLSPAIAAGQATLGFMLPYAPLYHLLLAEMTTPIVLTSGNRSHEPLCFDNEDARQRLGGIADYLLLHDRDIVYPADDSVAAVVAGKARIFRRARGEVPTAIRLDASFTNTPSVLAMGGEFNNSFCQLANGEALLSPHMGELQHPATQQRYCVALEHYQQCYRFTPEVIAIDRHPDYFPTRWGQQLAADSRIDLLQVQHHHAHIAAVLAEQGIAASTDPVLGIVLDGLGLGNDEALWGGEFLLADYRHAKRVAHFQPVAMPGGDRVVKEPWRSSAAHLHAAGWGEISRRFADSEIVTLLSRHNLGVLHRMIEQQINAAPSSSCGRLFDAAAVMLGICQHEADYDAQPAMELEALAQPRFADEMRHYPFQISASAQGTLAIHWDGMWFALLEDLQQGIDRSTVAARFHRTVICAICHTVETLQQTERFSAVVLSGGAFQNRLLFSTIASQLEEDGLKLLLPERVPCNDGGLSLGQAAIAAATQMSRHA